VKDSFYEELERVFDKFPKCHTKILLGDFNAKVGREHIFKSTIRNESLHEINDDNGVNLVNSTTYKHLRVKSMMFPHRNIHKYTWTSPDENPHNQIDHILVDRRRHLNVLHVRSFRAAVVAKVRDRLAVNKQRSHRFHMERFNLKKLNEVEGKSNFMMRSQIRMFQSDSIHHQVVIKFRHK
jgi:hypothetical protein